MAFSRGLSTGWFRGINNQELVHARFGKKRGAFVGKVRKVRGEQVVITSEGTVKAGDGVVFDHGRPDQEEEGGRIYGARKEGKEIILVFGRGDVDFRRLQAGDLVWKTSDPELEKRVRQSFAGSSPRFQRPLLLEVHGEAGQPLTVVGKDELGHVARAESEIVLVAAEKQGLNREKLEEQLGRLGGTEFKLGRLENLLRGKVHLPVSELNRVRRELVAQMQQLRAGPKRWTPGECGLSQLLPERKEAKGELELIVLARTMGQVEAALRCGVGTIYCEFEDVKKYREAVRVVHSGGCGEERSIWVAPPRIFKMGEDWVLQQVRSANADGYLVRNYDHLKWFSDCPRRGDFSLNVANALSAEHFVKRFGLERVSVSYDLNAEQVEALLLSAPPDWFEITLHQHMPMFHMEHCVFCAFLSSGTDYRNCGRPCDTHQVKLRDRVGAEHPLKADAGCRNTVFNSKAQTGAEYFERFVAAGARKFRIEFLNETPEQVVETVAQYRKLMRGETSGAQLWRDLRLVNQLGVTRGQLAGQRMETTVGQEKSSRGAN